MSPEAAPVRLLPNGDAALVAEFGENVELALNEKVLALADRIAEAKIDGVVETQPTFRSLLVSFDPARLSFRALASKVEALIAEPAPRERTGRLWRLPVCYAPEFAPDLGEAAERAGLTRQAFVARHSGIIHRVYMLGFLPGQPYLGDLPLELALPRRATPRVRVAVGSVGIAQRMTCLFPRETPCGLSIIGRTSAPLWDPRRHEAALLAPGDRVIFEPVAPDAFERLAEAATRGEAICAPEDPKVAPEAAA
jgi:inhibitor of KinA